MNYTGNPRHLRARVKSNIVRRHRVSTQLPDRPHLDICQSFQDPRSSVAGSESIATETSESGEVDTFEAKRRRLLQQNDWLGLDVAAPIKVPTPRIP